MNNVDTNNLTAAILCSKLIDTVDCRVISIKEWHNIVGCLYNAGFENPNCLLEFDLEKLMSIDGLLPYAKQIYTLVSHKSEVVNKLKELKKQGISIIGMGDDEYPERLIRYIPHKAPPIFFCCGNKSLINRPAISVVGSRDVSDEGIWFATGIGKQAASEGYVLVSGGARGCDSLSESSATQNGGNAVLFLAVPMLEKLQNSRVKQLVKKGKLCLLSDFNPSGEFTANGALYRNQYIYLNSDAAFVCESSSGRGGTFKGATDNIALKLVRTFVYENQYNKGNLALIVNGGIAIDDVPSSIKDLLVFSNVSYKFKHTIK